MIYKKFKKVASPKFSILIPSWNNLDYLKICVNSILKNSIYQHQIVIHVNEGNDGTIQWLESQQIDYSLSDVNIGICKAVNASFTIADSDYILYMNDDMYVCPQWDRYLVDEINTIGHDYFYLSSTMIEPELSGNKCILAPYNFGRDASSFREQDLLTALPSMNFHDWSGSTWPPSLMHRRLWNIIGGFSIEFSPGMYSDPDISMKLWKAGVRYFKGMGKSMVYHFMSKSTGKVVKNHGKSQFYHKWKISNSTFSKYYLKLGTSFKICTEPVIDQSLKFKIFRDKLKLLGYTLMNK